MLELFVVNGPNKGQVFEIKGDVFTLGRFPGNDIQIDDTSVSKKHARITRRNGKVYIEDLNSTNGISLHGRFIPPNKKVEIKDRLPITMGNIVISFGEPYGFRKDDLNLLCALSGPVALAVELYSKEEKVME